jgi:two-component system response regulator DegU
VEVLRLVANGLPNRDIGHHLFITEKTVKKHLSNILGKMQSANRTQAVDQARRMGWL